MLILQTTAPDYRKKFFDYLNNNIDGFQLFAGEAYFETSVKTDKSIVYRHAVKNLYLFNRTFLFQTGMWKEVMNADMVVLEMNPRIVSNWLILIFRRVWGKKTILWGHAWPRHGKNSKSDLLRNLMRRLASSIIVYTKSQQMELAQKMPNKPIGAAPNALYNRAEMIAVNELEGSAITNFIYVGRLTNKKKTFFLVKAFVNLIPRLPKEVNLIIVGEGEEKKHIEQYVKKHKLGSRIKLLGHIGNYHTLKKLYGTSIASISPGYVGLSITQSFGFGIPMIISKDENHSPEIEATLENENAVFFKTGSKTDLGRKILEVYGNKAKWVSSREKICTFCKDNYSVESMAKIFIKSVAK